MDALISPQRFRPLDVKWGNEYAEVKFDEICWEFGEDFQQIITNFSTNSASNFYIQGKTSSLTSHETNNDIKYKSSCESLWNLRTDLDSRHFLALPDNDHG